MRQGSCLLRGLHLRCNFFKQLLYLLHCEKNIFDHSFQVISNSTYNAVLSNTFRKIVTFVLNYLVILEDVVCGADEFVLYSLFLLNQQVLKIIL